MLIYVLECSGANSIVGFGPFPKSSHNTRSMLYGWFSQ